LHWFLNPKAECLKNFTYETRNSSKRFCEALVKEELPHSGDVCATIKDANWFMASWLNDPTVVSMLQMLSTIQAIPFDKEKAWKNLSENRKITFDYIDIRSGEFKLTDELYIKMNSRGKPLTAFENFKALFSEILSSKDTDFFTEKRTFEGTQVTFQEYFTFKIDSVWTDLFWRFAREKKTDISVCFMNFFAYVAQMCFFKDDTGRTADAFPLTSTDFTRFSVFKKKENVLFLFDILDFFHKVSLDEDNQVCTKRISDFFEGLFLQGTIGGSYREQVRLFDEKGTNLFEKCLLEGKDFDNRNRIMLYCLVAYAVKYEMRGLHRYVRVIRNLLQATRQRNETVYNTNVRINEFGLYWKLFSQLMQHDDVYLVLASGNIDNAGTRISDRALNNEKEKAEIITDGSVCESIKTALIKLEESELFGGLIHQLKPKENHARFPDFLKAVNDFETVSDKLRIASLIACGFGGFYTKRCSLGEMWTFGRFNTIFTGEGTPEQNDGISQSLLNLLNDYCSLPDDIPSRERFRQIISDKLNQSEKRNWRFYFLKYDKDMLKKDLYLSWKNDFECERLSSENRSPLLSYHINPYVWTVSNMLEDEICKTGACWEIYGNPSKVVLWNNVKLNSKEDGWHIALPDGETIPEELRAQYGIDERNILFETKDKDRIEVAVDFCRQLFSQSATDCAD